MPQNSEALTSVEESTQRQRRWGCTCGCLTFLVAVIVGSLAVVYYALRPYPLLKADRWLNSTTIGFGQAQFSSADSGMSDLISFLATRVQENLSRELSPREQQTLHSAITLARQSTDWVVYPQIYIYVERSVKSSAELRVAGLAQFRHFFGYLLFRMALQSLGLKPIVENPTALVYRFGGSESQSAPVLIVTHTRCVFSNKLDMAESLSQASGRERTGNPSERFMTYYSELSTDTAKSGQDLCFALTNESNVLASFLEYLFVSWGQHDVWAQIQETLSKYNVELSEVQGTVIVFDVVSSDQVKCVAEFFVDQPASLKKLAEAVKLLEGLPAPTTSTSSGGVSAKVETRMRQNYVEVTVHFKGLRNVLTSWFATQQQANPRKSSQQQSSLPDSTSSGK